MKIEKSEGGMTFKQAVEATPDIANGFKSGLTALGKHSSKVTGQETRLIEGSVDIDSCTKTQYPGENRWDYAFSYNKEVFFVEIHPANTGEVQTVLKKLQWLKDWLRNHAPEVYALRAKNRTPYYWIQSNKFDIPAQSRQNRLLAQNGLRPIPRLELS